MTLVVDPSGRYLYVVGEGTSDAFSNVGEVRAFETDRTTRGLKPLANGPARFDDTSFMDSLMDSRGRARYLADTDFPTEVRGVGLKEPALPLRLLPGATQAIPGPGLPVIYQHPSGRFLYAVTPGFVS